MIFSPRSVHGSVHVGDSIPLSVSWDNKPHFPCCGDISACASKPDSMVCVLHSCHSPSQINLLHPLVSWEWESYIKMAYSLRDIQAVCLHNNVYILGYRELICFDGDQKLPKKIPCPAANSTLTTYQGKLVLVGGHDLIDLQCTNKLWSLQDDDSWIEELPPMTTKRCGAAVLSIDHHLIVAGGEDKEAVEVIVEVFDGKRWSITYSPRVLLWKSKSVLHDGVWYVFGERDVVSASVEALIDNANGKVAEHDTRQNMWRKLEKLEELLPVSSIVIFRGHILILKHGTWHCIW